MILNGATDLSKEMKSTNMAKTWFHIYNSILIVEIFQKDDHLNKIISMLWCMLQKYKG